jgi:predicted nucleic-acid-binding Zn-ribbon protein
VATERIVPADASRLFDRRLQRLTVPPCKRCGSASTGVATRTDYVLYVRCQTCGYVWSLPKPGREPVGS